MATQLQAVVETTVTGLGYELVDLEIAGRGLLRVFIDKPAAGAGAGLAEAGGVSEAGVSEPGAAGQADVQGERPAAADGAASRRAAGIGVDDCERVSRQLTRVLEVEGIDYARLEVSSPGLDRPLKRFADYERFVGERVALKLREPLEGRRNFEGVLRSADDGRCELVFEGKDGPQVLSFALAEVDKARLVPKIEF